MDVLQIHLFGHVRLLCDENPVKLMNPRRTIPLLAYLLLFRGQPLKRHVLAQALWPDHDDESALASLRRNLFRIEKSLPPFQGRWLVADGLSVRWNQSAPARIDIDDFASLCEADATLGEAVSLYTGDLAENLYDEWLFAPRERLRSEYLSALLRLINLSRSNMQHGDAIAFAQRVLAADPLREDVLRQLMLSRYESGDGASALRDYREFAALLRSELDVAPMPETEATRELIARGLSSERIGTPADAGRGERREHHAALPMVGRSEEMALARHAWDRAARGNGGLLLVSGEAGIGKSRLVRELAILAQSQGARVLQGATASPESVPHQALVDAFRSALPLLETLELKSAARAALTLLLPELADGAPPAAKELETESARLALLDAIALALGGLARPRPLLIILEDVHWAGSATLSVLEYLTRRIARKSILLVATYREEEASRQLRALRRELQQEGFGSHIAPQHLSVESIEELVRGAEHRGEPQEIARMIYAQTGGNPLFITEALRQVAHEDAVVTSVREMIGARVERLSENARHLLEMAAVIGAGFTVEVLRDSLAWPEARVLESLNDLLDHRFVREAGSQHNYDYVFAHQVIQETVYAAIPPKVCLRRHHRIAGVLERDALGEDAASSIAQHWLQAAEPTRAAPHYLRAARRAALLFANDEALAFCERGLADAREPRLRCELLDVRIGLLQRARERAGRRADIDEYLDLAKRIADPAHRARALLAEIDYRRADEDPQAEDRALAELYDVARRARRPALKVEALLADATRESNRGQYERAEALLRKALAASAKAGLREMEIRALGGLLDVALDLDRIDETAPLLARAVAITPPDDGASRLMILLRAARSAQLARRDQECYDRCDQYLQLARTTGDRAAEAQALSMKALVAARLALFDESEDGFAQASALFEEIGDTRGQAYTLHEHATVIGTLGLFDEAAALLQRALAIFEKLDWVRGRMFCLFNLSATCIGAQRFDDALAYALQALEVSNAFPNPGAQATALRNVASAQSGLGEHEPALEKITESIAIQRTAGDTGDLPLFIAEGARIAALAGDLTLAAIYADEALLLYRGASAGVLAEVELLWDCAVARYCCGELSQARALATEAAAVVYRDGQAIGNEKMRARWLSGGPSRDVLAAHERGIWPLAAPLSGAAPARPR